MSSNLETRSLLDELRDFDKGGFFDLGHPLLNRFAESFVKAAGIGAIQAVSREAYFTAIEGSGLESPGGVTEVTVGGKKQRFPDLKGESSRKSLEALRQQDLVPIGHWLTCWGRRDINLKEINTSEEHRKRISSMGVVNFNDGTFPVLGPVSRLDCESMGHFNLDTGGLSCSLRLAAGMYSGLTYGLKEARGAHDWKNSAVAGAVTGVALALTSNDTSHEQIVQCAITGAAISTAANLLTGIF
ncbi:Outer envelope pore protein 16-2, chloroplastic [Vitis vinifera]|uniref:Outer envelope pore protein 16-2, chloroplastic n=1 Tax=Vitis vinifera TaxID=29760 RepID=A0A438IQU8_VITVI|nr:Outer envelope pore protein 16-2, chloroplastic [Vitis vinifera]